MTIPFTIQSVRFLLARRVNGGRLDLTITLEGTDLKNLPKLIDRGVVARLADRPDAVAWNFRKTLGLRVALPEQLARLARFEMDAGELTVTVDDRSLTLALPLPMRFARA